jgi:hypothetical protein
MTKPEVRLSAFVTNQSVVFFCQAPAVDDAGIRLKLAAQLIRAALSGTRNHHSQRGARYEKNKNAAIGFSFAVLLRSVRGS